LSETERAEVPCLFKGSRSFWASRAVLRLARPFADPCARPATASQRCHFDSPPGLSAKSFEYVAASCGFQPRAAQSRCDYKRTGRDCLVFFEGTTPFSPSRAVLRLAGPFVLSMHSLGNGESKARLRLTSRILGEAALQSVATSCLKFEHSTHPRSTTGAEPRSGV
jgi:hypothetical protein